MIDGARLLLSLSLSFSLTRIYLCKKYQSASDASPKRVQMRQFSIYHHKIETMMIITMNKTHTSKQEKPKMSQDAAKVYVYSLLVRLNQLSIVDYLLLGVMGRHISYMR